VGSWIYSMILLWDLGYIVWYYCGILE